MKWRQQEVAMRRDPFVFELIRLYGGDGYMAYNITLDILGEYEKFESAFETTWEYMASQMQLDVDKVKNIYGFISGKPWEKFIVKDMETHILIFCPNLKKYADEYTKKKFSHAGKNQIKAAETPPELLTMSGECRDNVGATIHNNTIHNNTIQKTNTKTAHARKKTPAPTIPGFSESREFWKETYKAEYNENYPYAFGKEDGILKSLVIIYGFERLSPMIKMFLDKSRKQWNNKRTISQFKADAEEMARATAAPQSDAEKYAPPVRKWDNNGRYIGGDK